MAAEPLLASWEAVIVTLSFPFEPTSASEFPPPDPPLKDRYRGAEFYLHGETLYMYSSASSDPRIIVYATANAIP